MMVPELPHDRAALLAATQATEANAELLRFYTEGAAGVSAFGEVDVVHKLAEALLHATRITADDGHLYDEERSSLGQLGAACSKFIADWIG